MCNCIEQARIKFLERATAQANEKGWDIKEFPAPDFEGITFFFEKKLDEEFTPIQFTTSFNYTYDFIKKDKTRSRPMKTSIMVGFSYCPFCGEPYKKASQSKVVLCDQPEIGLEFILTLPADTIFSTGIIRELRLDKNDIKWIAIKGGGDDWALYYAPANTAIDDMLKSAIKVRTESIIKRLVGCTDEALTKYRF